MNVKNINSEKGQAIVYLVIGLVVFLGFVALAIDGGMALADRRHVQNAADAASLAGGAEAAIDLSKAKITDNIWSCDNVGFAMNNGEYAAIQRAQANNFTIIDKYPAPCDQNCVIATCNNSGKYIDIKVDISATTPSNFLQLIFPNALHNKVEAVTRVFPGGPLAYGEAIVALNPQKEPCNMTTGAGFSGNAYVDVYGGGIFSNGCLVGKGDGKLPTDINVEAPHQISYFTSDYKSDVFSPDPVKATKEIPSSAYNITKPDCSATPHNITATWLENQIKTGYDLAPGLWCITGDLTINAGDKLSGSGVTIYMVNGWFTTKSGSKETENPDIRLSAPAKSPDPSPAVPGLLIYVPPSKDPGQSPPVTLNGNSNSFFTGTILAPDSDITVNGTSNTDAYHSQFIGYNVKVNGGTLFNIWYNAGEQASLPTSMELHR
jgi:hypothetical protein